MRARKTEPAPAPVPPPVDDLEALFDQVSAERAAAELAAPAPLAPEKAPKPKLDAAPADADAPAEAYDVFHRVGSLTRKLHDALRELGYDKAVEDAVGSLPDARSRLDYIATLTGQAAERVLAATEQAQEVQSSLEADAKALSAKWAKVYSRELGVEDFPALAAATRDFLAAVPERTAATRGICTEIMVAQDFHDLTGQVIQRVVGIAQNIEEQLVKLLLETTPPARRADTHFLSGPAIDAAGRDDVAATQEQVDDLLESLGF